MNHFQQYQFEWIVIVVDSSILVFLQKNHQNSILHNSISGMISIRPLQHHSSFTNQAYSSSQRNPPIQIGIRFIGSKLSDPIRFNSVITPPLKHRISSINFLLLQIPSAIMFPLSLHHIRFLNFYSSAFRCIFRDTANGMFSLNRFQFQVLSCDKQCTCYSSILSYTRIAGLTLLNHVCVEYTPPICFPSCPPSILVALRYIITDM